MEKKGYVSSDKKKKTTTKKQHWRYHTSPAVEIKKIRYILIFGYDNDIVNDNADAED